LITLFLLRRLTHGWFFADESGVASRRDRRSSGDDRRPEQSDAADDEIDDPADAQYRNGCPSRASPRQRFDRAELTAWRTRPLDPVWPIVYFDGIVVHVRNERAQVRKHAIYVALGVNLEGRKELLGLWLDETEGAKFWLSCLTDLKNRGPKDIFVACIDGLTGFGEAIRAAYPQTSVQRCIVHPRGLRLWSVDVYPSGSRHLWSLDQRNRGADDE
jgi:hypothetical protein